MRFMARKDSPMILGIKDGESCIASDVPAILKYTEMSTILVIWKWQDCPEGDILLQSGW